MKTLILHREDFKNKELGLSFDDVLDKLGIETHTVVAGRAIDKDINEVTIWVSSSEAEEN